MKIVFIAINPSTSLQTLCDWNSEDFWNAALGKKIAKQNLNNDIIKLIVILLLYLKYIILYSYCVQGIKDLFS